MKVRACSNNIFFIMLFTKYMWLCAVRYMIPYLLIDLTQDVDLQVREFSCSS